MKGYCSFILFISLYCHSDSSKFNYKTSIAVAGCPNEKAAARANDAAETPNENYLADALISGFWSFKESVVL